jgi:predicted ArsR family transcriptional regulator
VPTRAGIYRRLRQQGHPFSAREVADMFGLHANVARNHLDQLAEVGPRRHRPTQAPRRRPAGEGLRRPRAGRADP